ncbi:MAG: NUDIX domain-containing protein [Thermoleophilia bacterium]
MPAISAGILLYRRVGAAALVSGEPDASVPAVEVLLVHPGGPYWAKRDAGAWSIPKGEAEEGELGAPPPPAEPWQRPAKVKPRLRAGSTDLLAVAKREFREETGFDADALALSVPANYLPLGGVKQRGHKIVYVWALEGDCDPALASSTPFTMEWPPHSGERASFPEVDRAAWFTLAAAHDAILAGQRRFLDDLEALVRER